MKFWLVEISDFVPTLDGNNRLYRAGMLAKVLVEAGHEIVWWTSTFNHQLRRQRFTTSATIDIQNNYRLRLLYGPGYERSISFARWRHNRIVAREFAREIQEVPMSKRPDLIYTCLPTLEVSEQAVLFGVRHQIPVVVDIRELFPENYLSVFPHRLRPLFRILLSQEFARARRILSQSTAITSTSQMYLDWAMKFAKRKARSIDQWFPLSAELSKQKQSLWENNESVALPDGTFLPKNSLFVTFVGSFTRLFNFETVLRVAGDLAHSGNKDVQFLFVGDGEKANDLRNLSKNLDNFHMTNWCEKATVDRLLAVSSVGLAPYRSIVTPTLSNKPFEYMAAGIPILSSVEGELRTIIERESIGLYYKEDDPADLKEKILWFLLNPEERRVMGQKGRALLEGKYNADLIYPDFAEHLTRIAKKFGVVNG